MKKIFAVSAILTLALFAAPTFAEDLGMGGGGATAAILTSNTQTVALHAIIPEYIGIDGTSVTAVNFTMVYPYSAMVVGDNPVAFNTNYNIKPGKTVSVFAYLSGDLTGASGNTDSITPGNVLAKFNGAGSFVAFDGNSAGGFAHSLLVNSYHVTSATHSMVQLNKIDLELNNFLGKIPDTYNGTLNIVAQAI